MHSTNCESKREREKEKGRKIHRTHSMRCSNVVVTCCIPCRNCRQYDQHSPQRFFGSVYFIFIVHKFRSATEVELPVRGYTVRINGQLYRNSDIWIFLMSVRCLKCTRVHEHSSTSLCTTITRRPIVDLLDIVSTWFLVQFTISRLLDTICWSTRKPFKPQTVSCKMGLFITPRRFMMWILD